MPIKLFHGKVIPVNAPPVLGFCAFSGTGKTTLISNVLPILADKGVRVGVIKHAHHDFEVDQPGKDSYRLRKAGAEQMLVGSRWRWVLIAEHRPPKDEPRLADLLPRLELDQLDLVLVEGFKHEPFPKVELHRASLGKPVLHETDPNVVALATDEPPLKTPPIPVLDLNQPAQIADFILRYVEESATDSDEQVV
ncbi:MAG: molybdopterin-guanine dinucleotide biosynthesis protein B [Gammaproteobacteria bacterium]